jgi:hypothetical protein
MKVIQIFLAGAFAAVMLYLVVKDGGTAANNILGGLGRFNEQTFATLQGR